MAPVPSLFVEEVTKYLKLDNLDGTNSTAKRQHLQEELSTAPLFSAGARKVIEAEYQDNAERGENKNTVLRQYGLMGLRRQDELSNADHTQLVYANVSAPWSVFICGSQGSRKSNTLSCMLENSLIASSPAGRLPAPLAGMVLHYDKFTAFSSTQLCEAAYLCSSGILFGFL